MTPVPETREMRSEQKAGLSLAGDTGSRNRAEMRRGGRQTQVEKGQESREAPRCGPFLLQSSSVGELGA